MASDQEIADYLAGQLDLETQMRLEEELLEDPTSRAELVGQRQLSAGLHALLGDSSVLERAILSTLCSTPEESVVSKIVDATVESQRESEARRIAWSRRWQQGFSTLGKIAAVVALAAGTATLLRAQRQTIPVAVVRDLSGTQWSLPGIPQVGTEVRPGWISITAGVAELEMRSGARIVVQSPARLRLANANEVELAVGKLSATVPPPATGFTVHTDAGEITDIGTRFGVDMHPFRGAQVHVLEGRVEVKSLAGSEQEVTRGEAVELQPANPTNIARIAFDPQQFPAASSTIGNVLTGGGFESDSLVAIDSVPRQFGLWSGDPALVVPESDGIQPRSGQQMLRFELPEIGKPRPCEQWQIVDLKPLREKITNGTAQAVLGVWFNRAAQAVGQANMGVTLAAFKGDPSQASHFWAARQDKALAMAHGYIRTDANPTTWERAEAKLEVPADADFLLVQIAANYPITSDSVSGPNGHYADDAVLEIKVGPRAAASLVAR